LGFCGWADEFQIPAQQQALDVGGHSKDDRAKYNGETENRIE